MSVTASKHITYNNPQKPSGRNELFQKAFVVLTVTLASSLRYPLFNKTSAGCQNMSKGTFLRTLPRQVASICKRRVFARKNITSEVVKLYFRRSNVRDPKRDRKLS